MGQVALDITMSLDGFVTGPDDGPDQGLGEGGEVLHYWVFGGPWTYDGQRDFDAMGVDKDVLDSATSAGAAVVAGDKPVNVGGGASIAQQALRAGLLDELHLHIAPVILRAGRPLFGELGTRLQLERTRTIESPYATHIDYRITG